LYFQSLNLISFNISMLYCCSNHNSLLSGSLVKELAPYFVVVIGGVLALLQIKTNIVKSSRVKWIDDFRDTLSKYLSQKAGAAYHYYLYGNPASDNKDEKVKNFSLGNEKAQKVRELHYKLILYLNPQDENHKSFRAKLEEMTSMTYKQNEEVTSKGGENLGAKEKIILELAEKIIERETDKTRSLFILRHN